MHGVIETQAFLKDAAAAGMSEEERLAIVNSIGTSAPICRRRSGMRCGRNCRVTPMITAHQSSARQREGIDDEHAR
jgi:hypothetical protein